MRLGEISVLNPKNELDYTAKVAFVPMSYISGGYLSQYRYDVKNWGDIKKDHSHFATGDIGIAKITPCFQNRKSVIFEDLPSGYGAGSTELSIIRIINKDKILQKYLLWLFKTEYFIVNGIKSFTGTAGQQRIGKNYLSSCLIPLPPVEEQKRISDKINEIFALLDTIDSLQMQCGSNINTLKDKLLTAALTGRLVEQRPEEGTAEELYCQIQEEKERLVKEGKIKKEKPLHEITEEEEPFEIPETWKWVRLGEILNIKMGQSPKGNSLSENADGIEFHQGKICFNKKYIGSSSQKTSSPTVLAEPGSILLSVRAPVGKVNITNRQICIGRGLASLSCLSGMGADFIYYLISAYEDVFNKQATGTTFTEISKKTIENQIIPLPPLAEQKRIVNKLEEIMPLISSLKETPR